MSLVRRFCRIGIRRSLHPASGIFGFNSNLSRLFTAFTIKRDVLPCGFNCSSTLDLVRIRPLPLWSTATRGSDCLLFTFTVSPVLTGGGSFSPVCRHQQRTSGLDDPAWIPVTGGGDRSTQRRSSNLMIYSTLRIEMSVTFTHFGWDIWVNCAK